MNDDTIAVAAGKARDEAQPIADVRGSDDFRRHLVYVLTERTLKRANKQING